MAGRTKHNWISERTFKEIGVEAKACNKREQYATEDLILRADRVVSLEWFPPGCDSNKFHSDFFVTNHEGLADVLIGRDILPEISNLRERSRRFHTLPDEFLLSPAPVSEGGLSSLGMKMLNENQPAGIVLGNNLREPIIQPLPEGRAITSVTERMATNSSMEITNKNLDRALELNSGSSVRKGSEWYQTSASIMERGLESTTVAIPDDHQAATAQG